MDLDLQISLREIQYQQTLTKINNGMAELVRLRNRATTLRLERHVLQLKKDGKTR